MTAAVFVDSTTILYAQDLRYPQKQARSTRWLKSLLLSGRLAISLQVLNETYAVVRRKAEFAHWRPNARQFLEDSLQWATPPLDASALSEAWSIEDRYRIGFWDAMVLVSANRAGCAYFLSEDLNDGQVYGAVRVINPFRHVPEDVLGPAARSQDPA
jgi:predicted nucleic acid-binding protein